MQAGVGDNSEFPSGVHHLIGDGPTPDPTGVEWGKRYSVVQTFKTPITSRKWKIKGNSDIID